VRRRAGERDWCGSSLAGDLTRPLQWLLPMKRHNQWISIAAWVRSSQYEEAVQNQMFAHADGMNGDLCPLRTPRTKRQRVRPSQVRLSINLG
jgi:hypothetical protein